MKATTKPKTGRPPAGKRTRRAQLVIRCDADEYERWRDAASAAGVSLSDWVRTQLGTRMRYGCPMCRDRFATQADARAHVGRCGK